MYGPGGGGGPPMGGRGPPRGERRMTPKGQMSGNNMQPAITGLPAPMRAMFDARPPLDYIRPEKKKAGKPLTGIAQYLSLFDTTAPPERPKFVTNKERKTQIRDARMRAHAEAMEINAQAWNPHTNSKATEDPYKTLLVARLSYDTTEKKLRREFEQYGPIKTLRLISDEEGKPRGYAFVEFEREQDMKNAYKRADGRKIDGKRVVVDVERGRTVKGWRPRKFGGGLGGTRNKGGAEDGHHLNGGSRGDDDRHGGSRDGGRGRDDASRNSYDSREKRRSRSKDRSRGADPARDSDSTYRPAPREERGKERGDDRDRKRRSRSRSRSRDRIKRERVAERM